MALTTFDPPVAPSLGTGVKPQVKVLQAEFGDGYTQSAPAGLNHIRDVLELSWEGLLEAQRNEINAFFRARGGTEPFYYQPVGDSSPRKWTCQEWTSKKDAIWKMTATLVESFTSLT